ncbi:PRC-barrel domain-containing protein [uncultured Methanobrevibacter sp.]|uniref:PRC-barrel domain-containing protein n=1 Tax=uncultured Methanobrevibacter sp. TaxID=253161 RepID=UPI0025E4B239|nr:PRC-barrel domain-containing protein [uncultured Methanobrevibacter sp.]
MKIREFLGSTVLDKNAYEVGKIGDIDFDPATGAIETITLTLQKNIFSKDEIEIKFEDVATIGAYVILNKEIPQETEEETVEATIEVEDDEE